MLIDQLKAALGIRDSMRLFAASDVVRVFDSLGEFSRSEVLRTFSDVYGVKCLDRALADLEAGNVLRVVQSCKQDVGAGASYRVNEQSAWRERVSLNLSARKQRHGRGGCRENLSA